MVCSAMVNCDSLTQFWGGIAKAHKKAFVRAGAWQGIEGGAYCESFGAALPLGAALADGVHKPADVGLRGFARTVCAVSHPG